MWYVIQTFSGEEERTANMIRKLVPSACFEECFVPKRERIKKFRGSWNKTEEVLFLGYTFVISEKPKDLYEALKRIPRLTKVLGREDNYFFPLGEHEERFVRGIGDKSHKTGLSRVAVGKEKEILVVEGPLKSYEGNIVKVNLHRREAVVQVDFMGRPMELYMGIEMIDMKH